MKNFVRTVLSILALTNIVNNVFSAKIDEGVINDNSSEKNTNTTPIDINDLEKKLPGYILSNQIRFALFDYF